MDACVIFLSCRLLGGRASAGALLWGIEDIGRCWKTLVIRRNRCKVVMRGLVIVASDELKDVGCGGI
jgi:hypothetical protein